MTDRINDWKERCKIECSCDNDDIVAFVCKDDACPNKTKQTLYCLTCMINGVHDHKPPVFISDEIDMQITKWSTA